MVEPSAPAVRAVPSLPHERWRIGRRCPRCGNPIVRGPVECCSGGHWEDVPAADVPPPASPVYDTRTRGNLARGYWLRWALALVAAVLGGQALLGLPVLLGVGALTGWLAYALGVTLVLMLLALVFAPPLVQPPSSRWIELDARRS